VDDKRAAVSADGLCKTFTLGETQVEVFRDWDFVVEEGEFAVLNGPSGSGKTTLLNIVAGIDEPTRGTIAVLGENLNDRSEDFLADFRCRNIGFVFQSYNLVSTLTAAENVAFPMEWLGRPADQMDKRTAELLEAVSLRQRADHLPFQLSGGEQQRIAFARALANDPPLLLVDEPTGNLDRKTRTRIVQILKTLKDQGKTVMVASHDDAILHLADCRLRLEVGNLEVIHE